MKIYRQQIIQKNYLSFIHQTNNLVRYAADAIQIDHKQRVLSPELKASLRLNHGINTFYDYQMQTGYGYSKLQLLIIISICSDIEFLLKDVCENIFRSINNRNAYYQNLDLVNNENFIPRGIDLNSFPDYLSLKNAFQIRHLAVHNMGFVDQKFNDKTGLNLPLNKPFPISEDLANENIAKLQNFFDWLDTQNLE